MTNQDHDTALWLKHFALQRKPYITLADSLDGLYQEFKAMYPGLRDRITPFDFTLLEHTHEESIFRFILSYSAEKFSSIWQHRALLAGLVNQVFAGTDRDPRDAYYRDRVLGYRSTEAVEFLTAVFHLSYTYRVPVQFNPGRILEHHRIDLRPIYHADLVKRTDRAGFYKIRIGRQVFNQVPDSFYDQYKNGEPFFQDWIAVVQNLKSLANQPPVAGTYHLYLPIYDGLRHRQGVLRGILGVYFPDRASRQEGKSFFRSQADHIQNQINQAFLSGTTSFIIDGYLNSRQDPLAYLEQRLQMLHHWSAVELLDEGDAPPSEECWWLKNDTLYISIDRILSRRPDPAGDLEALSAHYRNKVLALRFPQLFNVDLQTDATYVPNRIRQWAQVLDALLEKRRLLSSLESTRNAGRRSAVAAIMSRNMSHNIGSHVLARLAQQTELPAASSLSRFHAYLATRMDFLADVSTQTDSVALAKRFYRDLVYEFKSKQMLLLDHISGTTLTGEQIRLICRFENRHLTLQELSLDPMVALPNDVLGAQAFYVILENIIRNCAKHARIPDELILDLDLDRIPDKQNAYFRLRIRDHLAGCLDEPDLVQRINAALRQPIIDEQGALQPGHWGLLEMKIAAAYLRQVATEDIDQIPVDASGAIEPPLLRAVEVDQCLSYELYLGRPQFVLILYPQEWSLSSERQQALAVAGITCRPAAKPSEQRNEQKTYYEMVLLLGDEGAGQHKNVACARWIPIATEEANQTWLPLLHQATAEKIMAALWHRRNQLLWQAIPALCISWGEANQEAAVHRYELDQPATDQILFDLHGDWYKKSGNPSAVAGLKYYQPYGSTSPTGLLLNGWAGIGEDARRWMIGEFLEAAWTGIAIIDERVQQQALQQLDPYTGRPLIEHYRNMRIFLPAAEIDLSRQGLDRTDEINLWSWLRELHEQKHLTFLVIHLGVVEKMIGSEPARLQDWFDRLSIHLQEQVACVIISGRGTPSFVPKGRSFLPYSLIAKYVLDQPSKYHLNKILFAGLSKAQDESAGE